MNHTPGPWRVCQASNQKCQCGMVWSIPGDFPVFSAHNCVVGVAHEHMADDPDMIYATIPAEMRNANAKLIAAAPELLEALQAMLSRFQHVHNDMVKADYAKELSRKAIEKATT